MSDGTVKGTSLAFALDLVRERHGAAGIHAVRARLPEDVRSALPDDLRPLPSQAYPFDVWAELLVAVDALYGTEQSLARESSRIGYARLLHGIYRNWLRPGDARGSVLRLPFLWDQVTRGLGTLEAVEARGQLMLIGRFEVPARFRTMVSERVAGTIEGTIDAAGGSGRVTMQVQPDRTEYLVSITDNGLTSS